MTTFLSQPASRTWYAIFAVFFTFIVGILATLYAFSRASASAERSLLRVSTVVANTLSPDHIKKLTGSESDVENTGYIELKGELQRVRSHIDGVRFIYLTGYRDNNIFFFVDSEPTDSPDYSPPGQVYSEASQEFKNVFVNKKPVIEGVYTDRWGTWVSALVPVLDPTSDEVIAVMGVDSAASTYYKSIFLYSATPAVATSFLVVLVIVTYVIRKREKQSMQLKYELISIASHELRSPLTGIRWAVDMLMGMTSSSTPHEQLEAIEQIKESSDRLLFTVNDLLNISASSRNEKSKKDWEVVDIKPIIDDVLKSSQLEIKRNSLKVVFEKPFSTAPVFGDEDKLRRLFGNLVTNAVKYSRENSTITIDCDLCENNWVFSIKDQGIGIPAKDQGKIFGVFYRAENAKSKTSLGTGLGLYYVKQVAETHKGKVWFESQENVGSTFYVKLPVCKKR